MPGNPFSGFTGPSYRTFSKSESCNRTANFYCEIPEIPYTEKSKLMLYPRAGSTSFSPNPVPNPFNQPVRGMICFDGNGVLNGAAIGVSGTVLWQLGANGAISVLGSVANDGNPVQIVANAAEVGQIFIASAGEGYCLSDGTLIHIVNDGVNFFGARSVSFMDGYFIVLSNITNNQQFQISSLNDGTTWSGLDIGILLGQADPIEACIVNIEYIYFIGARRGQIWYNSGNALFPFTIESGAFLEVGTCAPASVCQVGPAGTIYWIAQDARGANVAMRAQGLASQPVSDRAIETEWQGYSTTADCICYPLTWNGHSLVRYIFPTADKGWEFDATESAKAGFPVWTEISFLDQNGVPHAPFERAHCYAFGQHLIGSGGADGQPGVIYAMSQTVYQDAVGSNIANGLPIVTTQTAELVSNLSSTGTSFSVFASSSLTAPAPFYFTFGGGFPLGELCLCTAIAGEGGSAPALTVVRGLGGTTAQAWNANTVLTVVIVPGFPMNRERIVRLPWNGGMISVLNRLEIFGQPGTGNTNVPAPVLMVSVSVDGGNTYGPELQVQMGRVGQNLVRWLLNRLGYYRDGVLKVRCTDNAFLCLVGAQTYITPGNS